MWHAWERGESLQSIGGKVRRKEVKAGTCYTCYIEDDRKSRAAAENRINMSGSSEFREQHFAGVWDFMSRVTHSVVL
jgi:hypothetical protein